MRSARLAVSDAFDEILELPDAGRSLGLDGIYQKLGAELNRARNMLSCISVEAVVDLVRMAHWQSPCALSEFISNVFDNATTAYAPILLPKIQAILRSDEPPMVQRRQFMILVILVREFMREDMPPQVKRHIKFAFVED